MTSTNDGNEVNSNQRSGHRNKSYYIELYKSLEARLNGEGSLEARTTHVCEAWRRVYSLYQHSAPSTHPHLFSWLQRHTASTVLQSKWAESKNEHARLTAAIDSLVAEVQAVGASRDLHPWEQLLLQRAAWFRKALLNPWGHPVLKSLINPNGEPVTDQQVLEWLVEERGIVLVTRLRQLVSAGNCDDLALLLASAVMDRARAHTPRPVDTDDKTEEPEDKTSFVAVLEREASFTTDVWELLTDIELVLLLKTDKRPRCIELAKLTPLRHGYAMVERLRNRLETSPRDKKLWKHAKEVATLVTQVIIARCMVVPVCGGVGRAALYCCARSLARLVPPARLPPVSNTLAAAAATARHLHTFCTALDAQCSADMKPFICELYVRAITAGMNELEQLKLNAEKPLEARSCEQMLASWFTQLGALLAASARLRAECALTAFSVHPASNFYERVADMPQPPPLKTTQEPAPETTSEFGSWANDSRTQSNLVKTSETLQMKQTEQHQANVLSTAVLTEGEALGLEPELCQDLAVLLSGPRVKTLSWDMDREALLANCRSYMERTHGGTRAVTTELKYLNLDPSEYVHLPEEDEEETGIERGYEHELLMENPEEIWEEAFFDGEITESAEDSEVEIHISKLRKVQLAKMRKDKKSKASVASSEDEEDPLSCIVDVKKEKKKLAKEKSKEQRRKKTHKRDTSKDDGIDRRKVKDKKTKKESKKDKSEQPMTGSLTSLLGMKVTNMPSLVQDSEKRVRKKKERRRADEQQTDPLYVSVTDSDYDSQEKSSQKSDEPNIVVDGVFSMDELKSPERQSQINNMKPSTKTYGIAQSTVINDIKSRPKLISPKVSTTSDDSDVSRSKSPYLTPNQLGSRHVVSSKVKSSISKLLQFRRNKCQQRPVPSKNPAPSNIPPINTPPVNVPQVNIPTVNTLPVKTPLVNTPPVNTPPVNTPPVNTPPVNTPPVNIPPVAPQTLVGMKVYNAKEVPKVYHKKKQTPGVSNLSNFSEKMANVTNRSHVQYQSTKPDNKLQNLYNVQKHSQDHSKNILGMSQNVPNDGPKVQVEYLHSSPANVIQHSNFMTNHPPSQIHRSYISPVKTVDHISPQVLNLSPSKQTIIQQPFHRSLQNLSTDNMKYDTANRPVLINDPNYRQQAKSNASLLSPRIISNTCIKSPNQTVTSSQCAKDDLPHSNLISRGSAQNVSQVTNLKSDVIRYRSKQLSSSMQDVNDITKKHIPSNKDMRLGHSSNTTPYSIKSQNDISNKSQTFQVSNNSVSRCTPVQNHVKTHQNALPTQHTSESGLKSNYQEFLENLTKSINAGSIDPGKSIDLNKHVKVTPVQVPSMSVSSKRINSTPCAKQLIQQIKTETAPNTFSRRNYNKNKQNAKSKLLSDNISLELNKNIMDHKLIKAKCMKNNVVISRVPNAKQELGNVNNIDQSSMKLQKTCPVLTSILDSPKKCVAKGPTHTNITTTTPSASESQTDREHADLLLLLRQQPVVKPNSNTIVTVKTDESTSQKASGPTLIGTKVKNINTLLNNTPPVNKESTAQQNVPQDWERVMDALLAHKTEPLGPNALDMVLKKDYKRHAQISSRSQPSQKPRTSSQSSSHIKPDTKQREHSSKPSSASRQPSNEKSSSETPKKCRPSAGPIKKASSTEILKKHEIENKYVSSNSAKEDDPFISGIPNSAYDMLGDLLDDDLRQELGELSSDEDAYNTPNVAMVKEKSNIPKMGANECKISNTTKDISHIDDTQTILRTSELKPDIAVNSGSITCYNNVITNKSNQQDASTISEPRPAVVCSNIEQQHTATVITNQIVHPAPNMTNHAIVGPSHFISNIDPTNVIIASVPVSAQPVVVIRQDLVYDPYPTIRIHESQVSAGLCSVNQNVYAINSTPNIAVYQTTQFAAPVINPVIIGNAMTSTNASDPVAMRDQQCVLDPKRNNAQTPNLGDVDPTIASRFTDGSNEMSDKSKNLDFNMNKNCERKVLSQVQENHLTENDNIESHIRKISEDYALKTEHDERLKLKRQSLLNRKINHACYHPPIPLTYTPLSEKVCVGKILKKETSKNGTITPNLLTIPNCTNTIEKSASTDSTNLNSIESINAEINNENDESTKQSSAKENQKSCRRIWLRSSNKLDDKVSPANRNRIPLRRNNFRLKVTKKGIEKVTVIRKKDKVNRVSRISRRLMDKNNKHDKFDTTVSSLDQEPNLKVNERVSNEKDKSLNPSQLQQNVVENSDLIDFEEELWGSKILKIPTTTVGSEESSNPATHSNDITNDEGNCITDHERIANDDAVNDITETEVGKDLNKPTKNDAKSDTVIERLQNKLGDQLVIKNVGVTTSELPGDAKMMTVKNNKSTILANKTDGKQAGTTVNSKNYKNATKCLKVTSEKGVRNKPQSSTNNADSIDTNETLSRKVTSKAATVMVQRKSNRHIKSITTEVSPTLKALDTSMAQKVSPIRSVVDHDEKSLPESNDTQPSDENIAKTNSLGSATNKTPQTKTNRNKSLSCNENVKDVLNEDGASDTNADIVNRNAPAHIDYPTTNECQQTNTKTTILTEKSKNIDNGAAVTKATENWGRIENNDNRKIYKKGDIQIEELPTSDQNVKHVRISLPSGKVFKAAISGKVHGNFDSLFDQPTMKSILEGGLSDGKRYTVNYTQVLRANKGSPNKIIETHIQNMKIKDFSPTIDTVNLVSDEEDETEAVAESRIFTTEFGKYPTTVDQETFNLHQKQIAQKCEVNVVRYNLKLNAMKLKVKSSPSVKTSVLTRNQSKVLPNFTITANMISQVDSSDKKIDKLVTPVNVNSDDISTAMQETCTSFKDMTMAKSTLVTRDSEQATNTSMIPGDVSSAKDYNKDDIDLPPDYLVNTVKSTPAQETSTLPRSISPVNKSLPKYQSNLGIQAATTTNEQTSTLSQNQTSETTQVLITTEVIEIDDSSNDSVGKDIRTNADSNKTAGDVTNALTNVLMENLGVKAAIETDNNVVVPPVITPAAAVTNLKTALLQELGIVPSLTPVIDIDDSDEDEFEIPSVKQKPSNIKECVVKIIKCDNLIKKYKLMKAMKRCYVKLERLNNSMLETATAKLYVTSDTNNKITEEPKQDTDEDFIQFDVEEPFGSPQLSRCPSLSILNNWDDADQRSQNIPYPSSPVMEVYDAIVELNNKLADETEFVNLDTCALKCDSEWTVTKSEYRSQELLLSSITITTENEEIEIPLAGCDGTTVSKEEKLLTISKAPKLLTIVIKFLEDNPDLIYQMESMRKMKTILDTTNTLKRKTDTSYEDSVANKILKLETLALNALNSCMKSVAVNRVSYNKDVKKENNRNGKFAIFEFAHSAVVSFERVSASNYHVGSSVRGLENRDANISTEDKDMTDTVGENENLKEVAYSDPLSQHELETNEVHQTFNKSEIIKENHNVSALDTAHLTSNVDEREDAKQSVDFLKLSEINMPDKNIMEQKTPVTDITHASSRDYGNTTTEKDKPIIEKHLAHSVTSKLDPIVVQSQYESEQFCKKKSCESQESNTEIRENASETKNNIETEESVIRLITPVQTDTKNVTDKSVRNEQVPAIDPEIHAIVTVKTGPAGTEVDITPKKDIIESSELNNKYENCFDIHTASLSSTLLPSVNVRTSSEQIKNDNPIANSTIYAAFDEISIDDLSNQCYEVEIVDSHGEDNIDTVGPLCIRIAESVREPARINESLLKSPVYIDSKEILFNYHDYTKQPKQKDNVIINVSQECYSQYNREFLDKESSVEMDTKTTDLNIDAHKSDVERILHQDNSESGIKTAQLNLEVASKNDTVSENTSIHKSQECITNRLDSDSVNVKNRSQASVKIAGSSLEITIKDDLTSGNKSVNQNENYIKSICQVKSKPECKYELYQEDDWLTVITTENEKEETETNPIFLSPNGPFENTAVASVCSKNAIIKGFEYDDVYVFPLSESGSNTSNDSIAPEINDDIKVVRHIVKDNLHDIDFSVIEPVHTYSRKCLKRKISMRDVKVPEKKYRKCKNIDCLKQNVTSMTEFAYSKEYKRLLEYCSSVKFSYSRPFHKECLEVEGLMKKWPINGACTDVPSGDGEVHLFVDTEEVDRFQPDPATLTLPEEISYEYEKTDAALKNPSSEADGANFNMGFGEGSGRVIQNMKKGGESNISAATLSDVKQSQPVFKSVDLDDYNSLHSTRDDLMIKIRKHFNFLELRDRVRTFFKKSSVELKLDWIEQNNKNKADSKWKCNDNLHDEVFPFDLCSSEYMKPIPTEAVVQVVQVGQLPVSAAAQNPVTCDPRVTQVSDASPSQCSVDNSPNDDSPDIKTEYTELTTADLTLPLREYAQQNQAINLAPRENNIEMTEQTISLEMEIKAEKSPEIKEEIPDIKEEKSNSSDTEFHTLTNSTPENMNYSFKCNEDKSDGNSVIYEAPEQNDSETFVQQRQQNGTSEKTDQIAHAMNAAGITTTPETVTNTRAHALVNILSQKMRHGSVNTTQTATNTYSKTTSINAMALQQALAQILPPPLNQTGSSENNQTQSTTVGPQVLHIVQGKNASGNQITLVDNSQQSVISAPNATQVLHIVQNKGAAAGQTSNGTLTPQTNSFSGLSLVDAGLQQGGNQLLHIVNTGNQKTASPGQLLKRVNLLTNLTNVQGSNEQKMVQFVCKSADGKAIQLNAPHQRSMVLRLQPIETPAAKSAESQEPSQSPTGSASSKESASAQEIKSRSIYEENYAKFIQNSSSKTPGLEKSTSLPKFNQAFGKPVFQEGSQKQGEAANSNSHLPAGSTNTENAESQATDNAINLEHMVPIGSPPLLIRKPTPTTSQSQSNLVQQIKQTIAPMNIQTMHGGVIYTRQIPVNIGGGQTINLITVPSTELINDETAKTQTSQGDIEPSIIKIVPQGTQSTTNSETSQEESNHAGSSNENTPQPQPVLTQMRIKLPMLSKAPQMVQGARVVRPSFFQIQRNVIGGANQPVYQQLVLTAAPPLGQQTIRLPQAQANRSIKVPSESQSSSSESQMSSSTLEQLREFDMVLEQVKERSTVQPAGNSNNNSFKIHTSSSDTTDGNGSSNCSTESAPQVLYSICNNQSLNVAYVNRKSNVTTPTTSTYVRSPDSSGIADSPTSSTHVNIPHTVTTDSSPTEMSSSSKPAKVGSKSKSRPKSTSNPPNTLKLNSSVPPKTSSQKPLEDEQTTQRILYILAEYKEQVENSPDKDKPAPRRRSNPPSNPGSSKRKKSSSSRRSGTRDMSPIHGEDTCRTMGSEDSSCGTSQGDCNESCLDSHSPQDSPRKVARKITFDQELNVAQPRPQPQRNVIVADGQTITVARGTTGKPATAVLMPANYILPVSMVKGGQQIAIVTNRGPKLLTVGGEGGATNALLLQRLIGPAGLKPVLARPGVRHVRLPTAALHNLQAFNLAAATTVQPPDSTASPTPGPTPPELVDTRATSSPWADRDSHDVKPERGSSPEGSEPWNLPSSADPHEYSYEETVRTDNMDRTVLDQIPDRYSPDMEAQRIFDKMFDVDSKKSYAVDSPRYDIDPSDCDDKAYQVVQKKDGSHRQHRLSHVSAAALRHKYAILEHELRLQKSLSEECEDLGVDSPSASDLFPEAELLFAASPAHEHNQDPHHSHTPQPIQSSIPQPDMDDQIATDHLIPREIDVSQCLGDVGIVAVSEDGMQATIALDQEEFARSHPNTTFHSEPTEGEVQPFTIASLKGRHITSTIFHSSSAPATVLMTAPQATVISQAPDHGVKYEIENMINQMPGTHNDNLSSVLVKDDGLTRFDSILSDSRELHLNNASAIVHSGNATQVIRRVCYEDDKRDARYLIDEPDNLIAGDDAKMVAEDSSRDAIESMDDRSSHAELFWESNSASERRLDFSSDSDKCCKSPFDETSTDSGGVQRLDSVIKEPLRTYPAKREGRSLTGKTRAGERSPEGRRRVLKRPCPCCSGPPPPAPPRPKKPRQRKPPADFSN